MRSKLNCIMLIDDNQPDNYFHELIIKKTNIVMLSTSDNPKDVERARQIKEVTGFKVKPLTEEMLNEILDQNFPDQ